MNILHTGDGKPFESIVSAGTSVIASTGCGNALIGETSEWLNMRCDKDIMFMIPSFKMGPLGYHDHM